MIVTDFSAPANYKIRIKGRFLQEGLSIFESAKIKILNESDEDNSQIEISVKDQAHLTAILNFLYDKHFVIMNLEMMDQPKIK